MVLRSKVWWEGCSFVTSASVTRSLDINIAFRWKAKWRWKPYHINLWWFSRERGGGESHMPTHCLQGQERKCTVTDIKKKGYNSFIGLCKRLTCSDQSTLTVWEASPYITCFERPWKASKNSTKVPYENVNTWISAPTETCKPISVHQGKTAVAWMISDFLFFCFTSLHSKTGR